MGVYVDDILYASLDVDEFLWENERNVSSHWFTSKFDQQRLIIQITTKGEILGVVIKQRKEEIYWTHLISNDEYEIDAGNESEDEFDQLIDLMIDENSDIEIFDDFEDDSDSEVEELISERIPKKQKCSSFIDSNRKLTYTWFS